MKTKYLFMAVFLLLFSASLISAYNTPIEVRTLPGHEVQISIFEPDADSRLIGKEIITSDSNGYVSMNYSSSESMFNVGVFVKYAGEKVVYKKFPDIFKAGEPISLEVAPSNVNLDEFFKNLTDSEKSVAAETTEPKTVKVNGNSNPTPLTGSVISSGNDFISRNIFYIIVIGGLVFIFILTGAVLIPKKPRHHGDVKVIKLSELEDYKKQRAAEKSNDESPHGPIPEDVSEEKIEEEKSEVEKPDEDSEDSDDDSEKSS